MHVSKACVELVKKFEGCRLVAYKDAVGVWTIGYGHTKDVYEGMVISQAVAEASLISDLEYFGQNVLKLVKVPLSQEQFDALTSFVFNVGVANLKSSTLLKKLNNKDYVGASEEFPKWNKAGGKVLNGLVRRRAEEKKLFETGMKPDVMTYSLKKDGEKKISENFKVKEFKCKDGSDTILIDDDFVAKYLQTIRDYFGKPLTINSAYRTPTYNKKIGGATNSYHMKGKAFDVTIAGVPPIDIARFAESIGINGIILYNTFVHLDNREHIYRARNNNGKVTVVNRF